MLTKETIIVKAASPAARRLFGRVKESGQIKRPKIPWAKVMYQAKVRVSPLIE